MDQSLSQEFDVREYLGVLKRRFWMIVAFFVICATTVTVGTFLMTPLYKASTTILIEGENTNVLSAAESSIGGNSHQIFENYLETQMALIMSDSIAGSVASEFQLDQTERYRKREGLEKIFQRKFKEDITLERLPLTRMIKISCKSMIR